MDRERQGQELEAIQTLVAEAERLQSDPDGFTRLHTNDVVIVNFGGRRVHGRDNLHAAVKQALQTPLADVLTRSQVEHVDFLRPDVAVVSCTKQISDERAEASKTDGSSPGELPDAGILTYVVVKEQDAWRIALAQTTPVRV